MINYASATSTCIHRLALGAGPHEPKNICTKPTVNYASATSTSIHRIRARIRKELVVGCTTLASHITPAPTNILIIKDYG
jgi:hypothetical protein